MVSLLLNGPIRELLTTAKVCMLPVHSWDYCTTLAVDVVHRHYRLVRFGCPTPLEACLVPSGTLRASPEGKKNIQVSSNSGTSGPWSEVHFAGQSRAVKVVCFRSLLDNPEQQLKRGFLMPAVSFY